MLDERHVDDVVELNEAVDRCGGHAVVADDDYVDDGSEVAVGQAGEDVVQHGVDLADDVHDLCTVGAIFMAC